MLPPIDENILKCTTRKGKNNKRDNNNTWFSLNLGASQNNDTITDNSSTIDESTAASITITNNHEDNSTAMKFGKK